MLPVVTTERDALRLPPTVLNILSARHFQLSLLPRLTPLRSVNLGHLAPGFLTYVQAKGAPHLP